MDGKIVKNGSNDFIFEGKINNSKQAEFNIPENIDSDNFINKFLGSINFFSAFDVFSNNGNGNNKNNNGSDKDLHKNSFLNLIRKAKVHQVQQWCPRHTKARKILKKIKPLKKIKESLFPSWACIALPVQLLLKGP